MHALQDLRNPSPGPSRSRPDRSRPERAGPDRRRRGPGPELALLVALVAAAAACGGWLRLVLAVLAAAVGAAAVALGSTDLLAAQ